MKFKTLITTLVVAYIAATVPTAINGQSIDLPIPLNPSRSMTFGCHIHVF